MEHTIVTLSQPLAECQGLFFDGRSSYAYAAEVGLFPDRISICCQDRWGELQQVDWPRQGMQVELLGRHALRLQHDRYRGQLLELPDGGEAFCRCYPRQGHFVFRLGLHFPRRILLGIGSAAVAALALFFWGMPWLVEQAVHRFVPTTYDSELGERAYDAQWEFLTGQKDEDASKHLQDFADALALPTAPFALSCEVRDSEVVNAYALPGGIIVVNSGLLRRLERPEQLAALLAHEAVHVQRRHGVQSQGREVLSTVAVSLLTMGAVDPTWAQAGAGVVSLGYSRSMEREADALGKAWLEERGLSASGMSGLFRLLREHQEEGWSIGSWLPAWLSTHPGLQERIEAAGQGQGSANKALLARLQPHWKALKQAVDR